jgi:hypothetical protein
MSSPACPAPIPNTGQDYATIAAKGNEDDRYAGELDALQSNREAILKMGIDYDKLEETARRKHIDNLNKIDRARRDLMLDAAASGFASLVQITRDGFGKQSAVYKAAFIAEKAFTIAVASLKLYQAVADAAAKPFPANIPLIAEALAQGAVIISAITGINGNGFKKGGYTGAGGRDDEAGVVHGQEFVMDAPNVARGRNREILERMHRGEDVTRAGYEDGGYVGRDTSQSIATAVRSSNMAARARSAANDTAPVAPTGRISIQQFPGVDIETSENMTTGDVEIIARRIVARETPKVVASQLRDPNSKPSKALQTGTTARRKRN